MKISRFAKAIMYLVATVGLLAISVYFQVGMHRKDGLEASYFGSMIYMYILAATFVGTAIYSYASYTRRHREHRMDSLFVLFVGLAVMTAAITTFVCYGGLQETFTESGYTAANLNMILLTAVPVPFLIRSIVLACTTHENSRARRLGVQVAALLVAVVMGVLIATGSMMKMVRYSGETNTNSQAEDVGYAKT